MQGSTCYGSISQHNLGDARFSLYGIEIGDAQEGERQRDDCLLHKQLGQMGIIYKSIVLSSESGDQTRWRDADNGDSR